MAYINLLSDETINKIAAGEVVERPLSVVKELLENSIDAGASAVSIEIKEGGISYIRITDNGCGIDASEVRTAFLRHATSKIKDADDLLSVSSLGFRGEALASIAAVAKCELITKTKDSLVGARYIIEGGNEISFEEVGAPDGTTFIIRDLFYNVPARRKFLKSASTEGSYVAETVEKIALAHPEVSIRLIINGQLKLHTSGNGKKSDVIYSIYGREVSRELIKTVNKVGDFEIKALVGKPSLSRGNRSYEVFEANGRTIKSNLLNRATEDAYRTFVMQHKYPVVFLSLHIPVEFIDVNVHPAKLEVRFRDEEFVYETVKETILNALNGGELIREDLDESDKEAALQNETQKPEKSEPKAALPFETERIKEEIAAKKEAEDKAPALQANTASEDAGEPYEINTEPEKFAKAPKFAETPKFEQLELSQTKILSEKSKPDFKYIGSIFDTYLLIQFKDDFLMIDQHAAHEKVMFERFMADFKAKKHTSQQINPPLILTLSGRELDALNANLDKFTELGYEIEPFGGREIAVYAVPGNIYDIAREDLIIELLDDIADETGHGDGSLIIDKLAMMSCKAAVKGNMHLSYEEAIALIDELLSLDQPYTCPHGRPTAICMSKTEIEKKFKRII